MVAEVHPLKQGLKQSMYCTVSLFPIVAEVHPLKQGLKLIVLITVLYRLTSCRGTSIKTRIETRAAGERQADGRELQRYIH